tara:strand:+ start:194 stop:547 length:354 start_codon:yes stop_codon:yes gene_type:complete
MSWKDILKYEGPESERYRTLDSTYNDDFDEAGDLLSEYKDAILDWAENYPESKGQKRLWHTLEELMQGKEIDTFKAIEKIERDMMDCYSDKDPEDDFHFRRVRELGHDIITELEERR